MPATAAPSVNAAESFNAASKRAHTGVHHHTSPKHPPRHVGDAVFRWNGRWRTTLDRLAAPLRNGETLRLPYRSLVAA